MIKLKIGKKAYDRWKYTTIHFMERNRPKFNYCKHCKVEILNQRNYLRPRDPILTSCSKCVGYREGGNNKNPKMCHEILVQSVPKVVRNSHWTLDEAMNLYILSSEVYGVHFELYNNVTNDEIRRFLRESKQEFAIFPKIKHKEVRHLSVTKSDKERYDYLKRESYIDELLWEWVENERNNAKPIRSVQ